MKDEKMEEMVNKIRKPALRISRIPQSTLNIFKKYADEEFCGDYGMCLKWLVDMVFGDFSGAIMDHNKRISELEAKLNITNKVEPKEIIKTNSGLIINKVNSDEQV